MTDEEQDLQTNINALEEYLLEYISPSHNHVDVHTNQYNPNQVVLEVSNYINDPINHAKAHREAYRQVQDNIHDLLGDYSQLETDRKDPRKNVKHVALTVMQKIERLAKTTDSPTAEEVSNLLKQRKKQLAVLAQWKAASSITKRISPTKKLKPITSVMSSPKFQHMVHKLWNQNSYNYDIWSKDRNTFEDPNTSWKMIHGVLNWSGYNDKCNEFLTKYSHYHKGYQPFQYDGKMFYFPQTMSASAKWTYLTGLVKGYYDTANKKNLYGHLTDNLYRKMWHSLYTGDMNDAHEKIGENNLNDLNNHPTEDLPAERGMAKAMTNFKYKIQKDRTWEQYHQNQLNYMKDYAGKLQQGINKLSGTTKHHAYTYDGKSYPSYQDFPDTPHANAVKKQLAHLIRMRDNRQEGNTPYSRTELQNKINKLCGMTKRHAYTYGGKWYKDYHDFPKTKHGKEVIKAIDHLAYMRTHSTYGGSFYNQEVAWRDKWKRAADRLQSQLKSEEKKAQLQAYLTATVDNLKSDGRNGHYAYIRPRNPETEDSYVFMMVTEESPTHSTSPTTNPVEWGRSITTGTQKQPTQVEVSGYLFNYNLPQSAQDGRASQEPNDGHGLDPVLKDDEAISNWQDDGAEMFYSGTHQYPHCIITSWNPDYNTGPDGTLTACSFSMELQVVDYFVSNTNQQSGGRHGKSNHKGNKGIKRGKASSKRHRARYVIAKSGNTYSGIAMRKHVPISTVMHKNKYSATDIPIGSKIYY